MKKEDIAKKVSRQFDFTINHSKEIVQFIIDTMIESLKSGEEVRLTGFGKFYINHQPARTLQNFPTGKMITGQDYNRVLFRSSQTLKYAVN